VTEEEISMRRVSRAHVIFSLLLVACSETHQPILDGPPSPDSLPLGADRSGTVDRLGAGELLRAGDLLRADGAKLAPDAAGSLVDSLLALTASCTAASKSKFATDEGDKATVDICALNGAFFWKADMDIDCDGQVTAECNKTADPWFQSQTSFEQSDGKPLVASALPYIVIPLPDSRFSYKTAGILPGALAIVIYQGKLNYGVFGDECAQGIIGEASYAMAKSLGVDPDPSTGGTDSGVTYFVFTGAGAVVKPIEDHQAAVALGQSLATKLLQNP
jgi:hypothetical protein